MDINEEQVLQQIVASLLEQAEAEGVELDEEQLEELAKQTLKSYVKKATTSSDRAWAKADKEEDKAMSTDGEKYPEKQARHQAAANAAIKTWQKREKGIEKAKARLTKESIEDMLHAAAEGKPVEFGAAFNSAIGAVVAEKIDAMRPAVAAGLFGSKE